MKMEEELFDILVQYSKDEDCIECLKSLSNIPINKGENVPYNQIQQKFLEIKKRYPVKRYAGKLDLYEETLKIINSFEDQKCFYALLDNKAVLCPFLSFFLEKMQNEIRNGNWPYATFRQKKYSLYKKVI